MCIGMLMAARAGSNRMPFAEAEIPSIPPSLPDSPTLKYPMTDRTGDFVTDKSTDPFYLKDPPAIQENVEYDPTTGMYILTEKVGGMDVRPPQYMSYADYLKYTEQQQMNDYWKERANAVNLVEEKSIVPPVQVNKQFFDRLFGGSKIEIKPQGNVEMTLGANVQETANPNIPIRNRRTGGFDFNMNININVIGKIGDKLQLGIKYNTQSGFAFDNTVKIGYTGEQDDIIRAIELGNVSMPLPTRLITGSQQLFGAKTTLQFGRLTWTSVVSQQQSKKQSITLQNGAQQQNFSVTSDQYEVNKDFFLSQFFYDQYDEAMSQLPNIRSVVNITRIEVWVTNRNGTTQNVRNIAGFMDLGESSPYETFIKPTSGDVRPRNQANNLYSNLTANPNYRLLSNFIQDMTGPPFFLQQGQDYEQTYARKLNTNEFTYNAQLGYISLNAQLNPNDVLAVAFQYTYNGQVFQVGEFGDQLPPDSSAPSPGLLFLKLLKGTAPRTNLPIWHLMMKNIYNLGAFNISNQNFILNIFYNDPGGGLKNYMPEGCVKGVPLIHLLNLDNLDMNNDPEPDGLFDFIPGITILPQNGKLIFPVKEPFGKNLKAAFDKCGSQNIDTTYVYQQIYDSTQYVAQQFPEYNRFVIKGSYKGTNGAQISLGAGNIPRGSVTVTAGGQKLTEGTDYTVDYNLGRVTILNQSIISSGQQIKVDFENNNQFATQTQSLYGTRLDYKISNKFNIGGTLITLGERPFTQKVQIGDEPIHNTIFGNDIKYETNLPWITTALNKIYPTKEMSTISTYGEWAYLQPGHSRAINDASGQPQVYIDDFEGTSSGYDLKTPPINWHLASTPRGATNASGQVMFPEANLVSDARYGFNRALISWYQIDNSFYNQATAPAAVYNTAFNWQNHYTRLVPYTEVFPNAPNLTLDQNLYTFDMAFYPPLRGPYNFESTAGGSQYSKGLNPDGTLKSPQTRWGGIMRAMDNTDFVATNVEYIEFWLLDPFLYNTTSLGGHLYIDLGNISEDILRDSRTAFENGLSTDTTTLDATFWGYVPKLPPLVNAFDNDPTLRPVQDVGFDGLSDAEEKVHDQSFLTSVASTITGNPAALTKLQNDPSSDDYVYFEDPSWDNTNVGSILQRYKYFTGTEGNSPVQTNSIATTAQTSLPDKEDINNDNTMNQDEEYFQYDVYLKPGMNVGTNPFIVTVQPGANDPNGVPSRWIQFRIPIENYQTRVGSIPDFTSIQFMRMFLTGFADTSVILRFGILQLTRNQWRTYDLSLDDPCEGTSPHAGVAATMSVGSVGIEANGSKTPVNYVLPPGILRQQALGAQTNQYVAQDEQSLDVQVTGLPDCGRRAVFKNIQLDLRNYTRLEMYVHANRIVTAPMIHDKEVTAFIRIGSDFVDNYYEYEVPLRITPDGQYNTNSASDQLTVWPDSNSMTITLQNFITLKEKRNATTGYPLDVPFQSVDASGNLITIKGNPDLGAVKTVMLGVHNPHKGDPYDPLKGNADDGQPKSVEVWFDELRLNGFNQQGGAAALGTVNIKLADLGTIGLAGNLHTNGFGQVDQTLDQRFKDNLYSYNFTTGLDIGKLFPKSSGIRIPFYANYSQSLSTPQYDPFQFDIKSKDMINIIRQGYGADSARTYLKEIRTINTTKGFNFTNVRFVPKTKAKRPHIYDPGNFNFTYSYNDISYSDPFTAINSQKTWNGILGWTFAPKVNDLLPFKKLIKSKSKWFDIIRDIGFNPYPSALGFTSTWTRLLETIQLRSLGDVDFAIPPSYGSSFTWNRNYNFKYNPFKSLSIDFTALNKTIIDEPYGLLNNKQARDSVWHNVLQGGRNLGYTQSLAVNYNLPISKIPVFDFITSSVGYASTYSWTALPWQVDSASGRWVQNSLGNIINNTQNDKAKVDLNFKKLYDKIPFLKTYDNPNSNPGDKKENDKKRDAVRKARDKIRQEIQALQDKRVNMKADLKQAEIDAKMDTTGTKAAEVKKLKADLKKNKKAIRLKRQELRAKQYPSDPFVSIIMRPLLMLKKAGAQYTENKATTLPGFEGYSRILGEDYLTKSPGWGFVFGGQPGDMFYKGVDANKRAAWLNNAAARGWITDDTLLNQQFTQNRTNRLDANVSLEPFPDFKIDLTLFRSYTDNYSEFFKNIADSAGNYGYQHLTPMDMGSYTISYLPIQTMFTRITSTGYSNIYNNFVANRPVISQRLGKINPNNITNKADSSYYYYNPSDSLYNTAYRAGYGPLSQDVLIPAFLAAYNKQNVNKVALNPFSAFPMPNWRISYNGLTKFKWAQKLFTNFTINHAYNATLTVSSYQTNLSYMGNGSLFTPRAKDSLSGNYMSLYTLPSIVISQQFAPLIGVDMTMKNNVTAKFDFKMSRIQTLSFSDFQMIEIDSKQITVGAGYKIKGLKLPFKLPNGKKIRLNNDLTFRFDFSYANNITVNYLIDQAAPQITAGAQTITISPSVDYIVSKQLTVRLFFDQTSTIPKISSSYPTTNTKAGLTLRFSLAQ